MKENYAKVTFKILSCIPILFSLFVVDHFILPQKKIDDKIIASSQIVIRTRHRYSTSSSKELLAYKFFTEKGYEFSISKKFIEEDEITIGRSYIFHNIHSIKSKSADYSERLMSGLNGACFYFIFGLTITAVISLLMLQFNKHLSDNGFQNIILINSFLLLIVLYVFWVYK